MTRDERFISERFPRANKYHLNWIFAGVSGGANPLWLTEYLGYLARFVKVGGQIAIAGAGLMKEIEGSLPQHLRDWWAHDTWCLHSAEWWRRHWEKTAILDFRISDSMPAGWQFWLQWQETVCPDNQIEISALKADRGQYLGYVRTIGRRDPSVALAEPITSGAVHPQISAASRRRMSSKRHLRESRAINEHRSTASPPQCC